MKILKISAAIYIIFIAVIIALSDIKETQYLFREIRKYPFADKVGHFLSLGSLAFALNALLNFRQLRVWKLCFLSGSLLSFILITVEETSQFFIPNRTFDWTDLLASYFGILLFGELSKRLNSRVHRSSIRSRCSNKTNFIDTTETK